MATTTLPPPADTIKADKPDKPLLEDGLVAATPPMAVTSKEIVLNDITNTGVMAALIGGFALGNVQNGDFNVNESVVDTIDYLLLIFAVHSCTCSALTSAILYRVVNAKGDDAVPPWAARNHILLLAPMAKFGMGCSAYILSVLFSSFRTLHEVPIPQAIALFIGISSFATVLATITKLYFYDD